MTREPTETNRTRRWLQIAGLAAAAWLAAFVGGPSPAHGEIIDKIVARVNDTVITKYELEQSTTPYLLQQGMKPSVLEDPDRRDKIYRKVLEQLVSRKLLRSKAQELGLKVKERQVDQWLKRTRKRQGMSKNQFKRVIQRYDMSLEKYREMIRMNLLKIRFAKVKLGRRVSVSDDRVDELYRKRFGEPSGKQKFIKLRHILIRPTSKEEKDIESARKRAEKLLKKLRNEKASFEKLATKFSDGPSSKNGGLLGTFSKNELNEELRKHAWKLGEGELSDVVRTKYGFHVLRVDDVQRRTEGNAAKRKQKIRKRLKQKKIQEELNDYLDKLRKQAFVDIRL